MPSGAKKRKAARKKKEKENNTNNPSSTNNPQGSDDGSKSQDEKGSDGGEGSSPTYHEHGDQHHPFDGSEEAEERDPSAAQPYASDVKSVEEFPSDVKIDEVSGGKEDSVVLVERVLQTEESSESKTVSFEQIEAAKESYRENGNTGGASEGESLTEKTSKDENFNSFEEANAGHVLVESIDSSPAEETGNSSAESSVNSAKAAASVPEVENADTRSVLLEKSVVPPVEVSNLAMKINEDNAYPVPETSSVEKPKPKEYASGALDSLSSSPLPKHTNGAEHIKDSETTQRSENQPNVASTPNVVQRTSWLSCCGLFEVLSSSNR